MGKQQTEQRLDRFVSSLFGVTIEDEEGLGTTPPERLLRRAMRAQIRKIRSLWVQGKVFEAAYMAVIGHYATEPAEALVMLDEFEWARTDPIGLILQRLAEGAGQRVKIIEPTPNGGYAVEPDRRSFNRLIAKLPENSDVFESNEAAEAEFDAAAEDLDAYRERLILEAAQRAAQRQKQREKAEAKAKKKAKKARRRKREKAVAKAPPKAEPAPKPKKNKKRKRPGKQPAKKRNEATKIVGLGGLGEAFSERNGEVS